MGVASGCGEQEVGVASGSGWNLWVWLLGVVVRRYIDFLSLLLLYLFFFAAASLLFVNFFNIMHLAATLLSVHNNYYYCSVLDPVIRSDNYKLPILHLSVYLFSIGL